MEMNQEYMEFIFTKETATGKGLNNKIIMENLHDGTFMKTEGRIGIRVGKNKPKSIIRPIGEWECMYNYILGLGYMLSATEKQDEKKVKNKNSIVDGVKFRKLADKAVNIIIENLLMFANKLMETEYTVKVENISPEMLEKGKSLLDELSVDYTKMSVAEFNNKLKLLYTVIPRRIDNLSKKLAKRQADFQDIIAAEQELFDVMVSQINGCGIEPEGQTILEAYGLEWREVNEEEQAWIVKKLGNEGRRYIKAWKIKNNKTEQRFNDYCKKENLTVENGGIKRLFHGSRNENFWSIITTGLTINPKGVVITGKMFGNGTYFAPDACKSMGYTDRSGSRWAGGKSQSGFLGIYKVATGNSVEPQRASGYSYDTLRKNGYHSVWCKRGGQIGLRMDEVVVYNDAQDTIEYLVEIGL